MAKVVNKFTIVPMERKHVDGIVEILLAAFNNPANKEYFEEAIATHNEFNFVGIVRGKVMGFIEAHTAIKNLYIAQFAVHDRYRGKGLGDALLKTVIEKAQRTVAEKIKTNDEHFNLIYLLVPRGSTPAIKLYEKHKFKKNPKKSKYRQKIECSGFRMERKF